MRELEIYTLIVVLHKNNSCYDGEFFLSSSGDVLTVSDRTPSGLRQKRQMTNMTTLVLDTNQI
jgi:hypothetical protein